MSNKNYISVIIPAYNASKTLGRTIEALFNQTLPADNFEIIIVDDASTDDGMTRTLISAYEAQYPERITAVFSETNCKQGGARNLGLDLARGEYILFCDADDYYQKYSLQKILCAALTFDVDIVEFNLQNINCNGIDDNEAVIELTENVLPFTDENYILLDSEAKKKHFICKKHIRTHCHYLYRSAIVSQYNIRFASGVYYEEPKFIYQYYMCIRSYYKIDEMLYTRSILPTSVMRSGIRAASAKYDNVKAWMQMYDSLCNNGLLEKYYCEAQYLFIRYFMYLSLRVWSAFEIVADDILLLKTYMNQKFPDYKQNIYCVDDPILNASYQLSDGRILTAFELLSCDVTPDFLAEYNLIWTKISRNA